GVITPITATAVISKARAWVLATPTWGPSTYVALTTPQAFGSCSSTLTVLIARSWFPLKARTNRSTCSCVSQISTGPVSTSYACAGAHIRKSDKARLKVCFVGLTGIRNLLPLMSLAPLQSVQNGLARDETARWRRVTDSRRCSDD